MTAEQWMAVLAAFAAGLFLGAAVVVVVFLRIDRAASRASEQRFNEDLAEEYANASPGAQEILDWVMRRRAADRDTHRRPSSWWA